MAAAKSMIIGMPREMATCAAITADRTDAHPFAVQAYIRLSGLFGRTVIFKGKGIPINIPMGSGIKRAEPYCKTTGYFSIRFNSKWEVKLNTI